MRDGDLHVAGLGVVLFVQVLQRVQAGALHLARDARRDSKGTAPDRPRCATPRPDRSRAEIRCDQFDAPPLVPTPELSTTKPGRFCDSLPSP